MQALPYSYIINSFIVLQFHPDFLVPILTNALTIFFIQIGIRNSRTITSKDERLKGLTNPFPKQGHYQQTSKPGKQKQ